MKGFDEYYLKAFKVKYAYFLEKLIGVLTKNKLWEIFPKKKASITAFQRKLTE